MSTFVTLNDHGQRIDLLTTIGELIEFNTGAPGALGAYWWITNLEGWETPDVRQTWVNKAGTDGAIAMESRFDKRSLVLTGNILVPSVPNDTWDTQAAYWNAWNYLTNLLARDLQSEVGTQLTVYEIPYPKYVLCLLTGRPKFVIHPGYWEFSLPLICPDPHKYLVGGGGPGVDAGTW